MKKLLFYLCVVLFTTYCHALTHECLKVYLKNRQAYDDILDYVDNYYGPMTDCESAVKTKLADLSNDLRNRLRDGDSKPHVECIMRDIEEEDDLISYENTVLLKTAIEMISNWRFWKYFSKSSRLEELNESIETIIKKSFLKCKGHREFGNLFSSINDQSNNSIKWSRSGGEEYCIRTTLVQEKIITNYLDKFELNPRNVRPEHLNCHEILNDVVEKLYKDGRIFKQNIGECTINIYRKYKYAEYVLKAEVLSKLSNVPSKSTEKQNFINQLVEITQKAAMSC